MNSTLTNKYIYSMEKRAYNDSDSGLGVTLHALLRNTPTLADAKRGVNDISAVDWIVPGGINAKLMNKQKLVRRYLRKGDGYDYNLGESLAMAMPWNLITAPFAAVTAGLTDRRTLREQMEAENEGLWKSFLIPGRAWYNYLKRLGISNALSEHDPEKLESFMEELNPDYKRRKDEALEKKQKRYEDLIS